MARNYEKEKDWSKQKYERIEARIDKETGVELKKAIENDKNYASLADWITEKAKEYLNK